jgi:hypothetical protein
MNSKYLPYLKAFIAAILCTAIVYLGYQWFFKEPPKASPKPSTPAIIDQTTSVSTIPKASLQDPDVSLQQTYTAVVNGQKVVAPIKTSGPSGVTGVIKQEIDMTKIVDKALEAERKLLQPPKWELSTGIGVHDKDVYVPLELQKNYKINRALSAEVHLDAEKLVQGQLKVTGGEVKHTWKF